MIDMYDNSDCVKCSNIVESMFILNDNAEYFFGI